MKRVVLVLMLFGGGFFSQVGALHAEQYTFRITAADIYTGLRMEGHDLTKMAVNWIWFLNPHKIVSVTGPIRWNVPVIHENDGMFGAAEANDDVWRVFTDNRHVSGKFYPGHGQGVPFPDSNSVYWSVTVEADESLAGETVRWQFYCYGFLLDAATGEKGSHWHYDLGEGGRSGFANYVEVDTLPFIDEGTPVPVSGGKVIDEESNAILILPENSLSAPTSWTVEVKAMPPALNLPPGITLVTDLVDFRAAIPENYIGGATIRLPGKTDMCKTAIPDDHVLWFECKDYGVSVNGADCMDYVRPFRNELGYIVKAGEECTSVFRDIVHFSVYFAAVFNAPGDLDGDGDVDRNDISILLQARNEPADDLTYGEGEDPRDLDGDGKITVLDARKMVLKCTRPGCAVD